MPMWRRRPRLPSPFLRPLVQDVDGTDELERLAGGRDNPANKPEVNGPPILRGGHQLRLYFQFEPYPALTQALEITFHEGLALTPSPTLHFTKNGATLSRQGVATPIANVTECSVIKLWKLPEDPSPVSSRASSIVLPLVHPDSPFGIHNYFQKNKWSRKTIARRCLILTLLSLLLLFASLAISLGPALGRTIVVYQDVSFSRHLAVKKVIENYAECVFPSHFHLRTDDSTPEALPEFFNALVSELQSINLDLARFDFPSTAMGSLGLENRVKFALQEITYLGTSLRRLQAQGTALASKNLLGDQILAFRRLLAQNGDFVEKKPSNLNQEALGLTIYRSTSQASKNDEFLRDVKDIQKKLKFIAFDLPPLFKNIRSRLNTIEDKKLYSAAGQVHDAINYTLIYLLPELWDIIRSVDQSVEALSENKRILKRELDRYATIDPVKFTWNQTSVKQNDTNDVPIWIRLFYWNTRVFEQTTLIERYHQDESSVRVLEDAYNISEMITKMLEQYDRQKVTGFMRPLGHNAE